MVTYISSGNLHRTNISKKNVYPLDKIFLFQLTVLCFLAGNAMGGHQLYVKKAGF